MMSQTETPQIPSSARLRSLHARSRKAATLRAVLALILREMSTTYGRSPGGYIWAILEPAAGIALLTLVFSVGFHSPSLGTSFPMYYATGLLPFFVFLTTSNAVMQSIQFSRQLLAYPSVTYVDSIFARFLLALVTQIMVSFIVFAFIIFAFDTRVSLDFGNLLLAFALAALLGLGTGTLNCFLRSMLPVWQQVWGIVTRPLVLISGVIFLHDLIPQPYRDWLEYNPLVHVVGISRSAFYPYYHAEYVDIVFVLLCALIPLALGLVFLRRYKYDILHY